MARSSAVRRPLLVLSLLSGVAACQPQAPDGAPAPPPADAPAVIAPAPTGPAPTAPSPASLPAELSGDLDARGTEPFWAVSIRKGQLVLTRPDHPDVKAAAASARMEGNKAVWTAQFDGKPLVVGIWAQACSDGMSDRDYRLTAEVEVGAVTLKGCAAKTAAGK